MKPHFINKSDRLFGRGGDIRKLQDRARVGGLTAVVGRPLSGKSMVLQETARTLEDNGFLVGYHEYKGGETSHLMYAVADLYAVWLSNASMLAQAKSLWEQSKDGIIPNVARVFGKILGAVATMKGLSKEVGSAIKDAFSGAADLAEDFKAGGMQAPPLPYDEAMNHVALIARLSKYKVALILDAWDMSSTQESEFNILKSVLGHTEDWIETHVFLGVTDPAASVGAKKPHAREYADVLVASSRKAEIYELPDIDLDLIGETSRVINYLAIHVPATRGVEKAEIVRLIAGYAGVIRFWIDDTNLRKISTLAQLSATASDAQNLRYSELANVLSSTSETQQLIIAKLAVLPRLSEESWVALREFISDDEQLLWWESLSEIGLLDADIDVPIFGHETRHEAIRNWLIKNKRRMFSRIYEELVSSLALRCPAVIDSASSYFGALASLKNWSEQAKPTTLSDMLATAAASTFTVDGLPSIAPNASLSLDSGFDRKFIPLLSIGVNNRGSLRQKWGWFGQARADYTMVLMCSESPAKQKVIALNNRGLIKVKVGDLPGAITDFEEAAKVEGMVIDLEISVAYNRAGAYLQSGANDLALNLYTMIIDRADAPVDQRAKAFIARASIAANADPSSPPITAFSDLNAAIALAQIPAKELAVALAGRGTLKFAAKDFAGAKSDFGIALAIQEMPAFIRLNTLAKLGEVEKYL